MSDLDELRLEVRSWLEDNCPASMRTDMPADEIVWGGTKQNWFHPEAKQWMEVMAERGWTVPHWPKKYGGGGLDSKQQKILLDEMNRINARIPLQSFGMWMLGPALLEFASEEQKLLYLPQIARGEIRWCQGYSEPGSGSDLAGLQTKAEDKGDHYLVNGAKIWTSYADQSDWIFCLVRTDTDVLKQRPKQEGISFLLFDMASAGVSASPIKLISGASIFCQTFFQDVKVPKHQLVGDLNKGWTIAKRLLQHERNMVSVIKGNSALSRASSPKLSVLAKRYLGNDPEGTSDPELRSRVCRHQIDSLAFKLTVKRSVEEARAGLADGNSASFIKFYNSELNKRKYERMLEILGTKMLGWEGVGFDEEALDITRQWLRSRANSIEGGTSEVQLNVIAKRILGLPD
ncbi:MAG: alkylation response protein AidB-like acyl-CoA dehydrogenase [Limisphaerales bacterium]